MSVTRISTFEAADGKEEELCGFLQSFVPYITASTGCTGCRVLQAKDESIKFAVIESWDSIENHKASLANFPPETMQEGMALIGKPPKGEYYHA